VETCAFHSAAFCDGAADGPLGSRLEENAGAGELPCPSLRRTSEVELRSTNSPERPDFELPTCATPELRSGVTACRLKIGGVELDRLGALMLDRLGALRLGAEKLDRLGALRLGAEKLDRLGALRLGVEKLERLGALRLGAEKLDRLNECPPLEDREKLDDDLDPALDDRP